MELKGKGCHLRNIILHAYKLVTILTDTNNHAFWDSHVSRSSFLSCRCPSTPDEQLAKTGEEHVSKMKPEKEGTQVHRELLRSNLVILYFT